MQNEIAGVQELTGTAEKQIVLHDDGYWSRAHVINGGEFVVKFPKHDDVSYESEAKFLGLLDSVSLPVNTQKVKWLAEDNRCIVVFGVKGTLLSKITNLSTAQKQSIGEQIAAFLMSTITCPKFGVPLWGELFIVEKWVLLIRKVIFKYKNRVSEKI